MEENIQLIADFLARIQDLPDFFLALGMMIMFAHGVKSGQDVGRFNLGI
jgi:hypothetical protein